MSLEHGDARARIKALKEKFEKDQRDLALVKFINGSADAIKRFDRGGKPYALICAYDFSPDIVPLQAIVPGELIPDGRVNFAIPQENLLEMFWEKVLGQGVREIGGETEFEAHYTNGLTPLLRIYENSDKSFKVNQVRWQLMPPYHRSGILTRSRYSLSRDFIYSEGLPIADLWIVQAEEGESDQVRYFGSRKPVRQVQPRVLAVAGSSVPRRFS